MRETSEISAFLVLLFFLFYQLNTFLFSENANYPHKYNTKVQWINQTVHECIFLTSLKCKLQVFCNLHHDECWLGLHVTWQFTIKPKYHMIRLTPECVFQSHDWTTVKCSEFTYILEVKTYHFADTSLYHY